MTAPASCFRRNSVLIAGIISLVLAAVMSFAWRENLLEHLNYEPVRSHVVEIHSLPAQFDATVKPSDSAGEIIELSSKP